MRSINISLHQEIILARRRGRDEKILGNSAILYKRDQAKCMEMEICLRSNLKVFSFFFFFLLLLFFSPLLVSSRNDQIKMKRV